jgi:hypothetical protein
MNDPPMGHKSKGGKKNCNYFFNNSGLNNYEVLIEV